MGSTDAVMWCPHFKIGRYKGTASKIIYHSDRDPVYVQNALNDTPKVHVLVIKIYMPQGIQAHVYVKPWGANSCLQWNIE